MNIDKMRERLEQLKPTTKYDIDDWREETFKWASNYQTDVTLLLQQLDKLQQENERYKEALEEILEVDMHAQVIHTHCIADKALKGAL